MRPTIADHIVSTPEHCGGRPRIVGTRIRVQDIVSDHEVHGLSPEEIAREYPQITLAQVHAALAYYYDHRDEIRAHMRADEEAVDKLIAEQQAKHPEQRTDQDADGGSLSP